MFDTFVDGYTCFNKLRKKCYERGRASGGVTVFVKLNLIECKLVQRVFSVFEYCG